MVKATAALWEQMGQKVTCGGCSQDSYVTDWGNGGGNVDPANPKWPTCPGCNVAVDNPDACPEVWAMMSAQVTCPCGNKTYITDWGWTGGNVDEANPTWPHCPECGIDIDGVLD